MSSGLLVIIAGIFIIGFIVLFVSKNIKLASQVMSGWGMYEAYNFAFDFVIWPILQAFFGFMGVLILILVALINNYLILLWYQRNKVDWFGVNVLEDIKTRGHVWVHEVDKHKNKIKKISLFIPAKLLQFFIWLLNTNDIFAFVSLSIWQDSFITTIFLRHGKFDELNKRDYIIFLSSTVLSCIAWSVVMQIFIWIVNLIWRIYT